MKIGAKIYTIATCSSTNDLANAMASKGEEDGTVILADEQTSGRGTKGRSWLSEKGKGLYISVILRPVEKDVTLLPFVAGLAVREALSEVGNLPVMLKWPNDLICRGKKLGGILCEASFLGNSISHAVLGVGLNVSHDREDFPEDIRSRATSLKILLKREFDVHAFLPRLWEIMEEWYGFFRRGKKEQIIRTFEEYSQFSLGDSLIVLTEKKRMTGKYTGIDQQGRLSIRIDGIERRFLAAEILEIKRDIEEG